MSHEPGDRLPGGWTRIEGWGPSSGWDPAPEPERPAPSAETAPEPREAPRPTPVRTAPPARPAIAAPVPAPQAIDNGHGLRLHARRMLELLRASQQAQGDPPGSQVGTTSGGTE